MCELNKSHIISTDKDPGLRIESFAVINLRGVSTNKTIICFIATQTCIQRTYYHTISMVYGNCNQYENWISMLFPTKTHIISIGRILKKISSVIPKKFSFLAGLYSIETRFTGLKCNCMRKQEYVLLEKTRSVLWNHSVKLYIEQGLLKGPKKSPITTYRSYTEREKHRIV